MERLYALHMLYQVANAAREHGHTDVLNWALAEIKEHAHHLATGETTQVAAAAEEE